MAEYIDALTFQIDWFSSVRNKDEDRKEYLLKGIANHNYRLVKSLNFIPHPTHKWKACTFQDESALYSVRDNHIFLDALTTDEAIIKYTKMNKKVMVLNFANPKKPGGEYLFGKDGREEELCRQYPRLFMSLDRVNRRTDTYDSRLYPIDPGSVLITHRIERLREDRDQGYKVIEKPNISCGFITASAPDMTLRDNARKSFKEIAVDLNKLFKLIFNVPKCTRENYTALILGAFGCGNFAPVNQNERTPYIINMAKLMKEHVVKYRGLYDIISIAIPNKASENYKIFREVFKDVEGIFL